MYSDPRLHREIHRRVLVLGESRRAVARTTGLDVRTVRAILQSEEPRRYERTRQARRATLLTEQAAAIEALRSQVAPAEATPAVVYRWLKINANFCGSQRTVQRHLASRDGQPSLVWRRLARIARSLDELGAATLLEQVITTSAHSIDRELLRKSIRRLAREDKGQSVARSRWAEMICAIERSDFAPPRSMGDEHWRAVKACLKKEGGRRRRIALVLLAADQGFSVNQISQHLGVARTSARKYLKLGAGGLAAACSRKPRSKMSDDESVKQAVIATLHEPPSAHGLNRTSWKLGDLRAVLASRGRPIGFDVIRTILRERGFRWRKAREVLTSADPEYRSKLSAIQQILAGLGSDERFFSIDEFGPFALKIRGGRKLVAPDAEYTVPQWQKTRGAMIVTAALELSTNQVTHFYSKAKNTEEMLRMAAMLIEQYRAARRLYLSWDAASWHQSKRLLAFQQEHNEGARLRGLPAIELVPLPSGAQFLNVIESVFSGMARSIIHNSDYADMGEARAAIDRYFSERNANFLTNPARAGKKIWGRERGLSVFDAANSCKDPAYR